MAFEKPMGCIYLKNWGEVFMNLKIGRNTSPGPGFRHLACGCNSLDGSRCAYFASAF
jgi:hypothetical protein